jgi:hypothetical protein
LTTTNQKITTAQMVGMFIRAYVYEDSVTRHFSKHSGVRLSCPVVRFICH